MRWASRCSLFDGKTWAIAAPTLAGLKASLHAKEGFAGRLQCLHSPKVNFWELLSCDACFFQPSTVKRQKPHPYPRPDDFPGTERDWYGYLLTIELDTCGGGTIDFDPMAGPKVLRANEEALLAQPEPVSAKQLAKSGSEQLVKHILRQKPGVAKRMLRSEEETD